MNEIQNNLPKRKPTRLKNYDYNSNGAYFITICTKNRKNILSKVVADKELNSIQLVLTNIGKVIDKNIQNLSINKQINIDKYVIMPNHIHILLTHLSDSGTSRTPSPTNALLPYLVSTLKRMSNKEIGENVFQRSYYDHIIRNDKDYLHIWEYIENNPINWELDELYKQN